ncbi:redoxin domain-containing protein [Candidatus Uhrbacteria bacterium]|nr:redoxin domain-containing protein [Candidatus Uhrbacteria bacterium]
MEKNKTRTFIIRAGLVAAIGILFYLGGRNKPSSPPPSNAAEADPHGHGAAANVSLATLNNLIDKPTPAFSLADRGGKIYSSDNLRGKNVILFFNEGLMCYPACWNQIVSLAKDDRFKNDKTVVLSVVVDSKEAWQKAVDKMPELAQATVVFDNGASVSRTFGVLATPSSMHVGSLPGHTYVVINKEGMVKYVLDDPNMGIRNDALAEEIKKLN